MTTWHDIQTWLRSQFQLTREEAAWCGWGITLGDGVQVMVAKITEGVRPPQLIIAGRIGDRQMIDPVEALRYNSVSDTGALVLEGQTYLLRQIVPLEAVTLQQVAQVVEHVAVEATRLRLWQSTSHLRSTAGVCLSYMAE